MTAASAPLLRFITAGSVDDGKSTLIGRLLYDSKTLLTDQLDKLNRAAENGETPDFASLTDGLAAEREQGITIDVAYRYFATPKRKFIIADTPGHEQYTRNMVTGASTADAAIILVDATRVDFPHASPSSCRRPTPQRDFEALGLPNIIVAVNKLDLLDFDEVKYQAITEAYRKLAEQIGLKAQIHFLPISALKGDNIVNASSQTPWYQGLPLLPLLESLPVNRQNAADQAAHFPVQRVARQDGSSSDDFRGYQGRLEAGRLKVGDEVKVLPSGHVAKVAEIYNANGKTESAEAGEVLTVVLDTDIDISRGNSIVSVDSAIVPEQQFQAALCWFDDIPLNLRRKYLLKHTTQTTPVKISEIAYVWDVKYPSAGSNPPKRSSSTTSAASASKPSSRSPLPHTKTTMHKVRFILIDEATNHTVAAGMIRKVSETNSFEI